MTDKEQKEQAEKKEKIQKKLIQICDYWDGIKDKPMSWETTKDTAGSERVKFHFVVHAWGSDHDRYLIFNKGVNQPQAKKVLDPILKKLAEANAGKMCKKVPNEVDMSTIALILDFEMTDKAN